MAPTTAMAAAAVEATTAMEPAGMRPTAEARLPSRGKSSRASAMINAAESAGVHS